MLRDQSWTEDDAREVLAALERSGDSVAEFARRHGLRPQRLWRWRSRLGSTPVLDETPISFAPMVVTGLRRTPAIVVRVGAVELDLVEPERVEAGWLAHVIATLGVEGER